MGVLIVGMGALACLFAARLAGSRIEVTMLGTWPEGLAALRQNGVRMLNLDGGLEQYPVEVLDYSNCPANFTQALVLVKSWQTERAATQLAKCLNPHGIALTLQNGLGNFEILLQALGKDRVALGVTTVGARMLEPGYVQHTGMGKVSLGYHPSLEGLVALLRHTGFPVEVIPNPQSLLWGKLVINSSINPLTALLRVSNGELLSRPSARQLLNEVASESALVAASQGIKLPYDDPVAAVEQVAQNTAGNFSSMLQDVLKGTPTEIEAINGAIIRAGEANLVPTPINRLLWRLVRGLDHS